MRFLRRLRNAADHRLASAPQVRPWRLVERQASSLGVFHIHARPTKTSANIDCCVQQLHHHGRYRLFDGTDANLAITLLFRISGLPLTRSTSIDDCAGRDDDSLPGQRCFRALCIAIHRPVCRFRARLGTFCLSILRLRNQDLTSHLRRTTGVFRHETDIPFEDLLTLFCLQVLVGRHHPDRDHCRGTCTRLLARRRSSQRRRMDHALARRHLQLQLYRSPIFR